MSTRERSGSLSQKYYHWALGVIAAGIAFAACPQTREGEHLEQVTVDQDGTVHIPPHAVPLSIYMSTEAKQAYINLRLHWPSDVQFWNDITRTRYAMDTHWLQPYLERAEVVYAVTV